MSGPDLTGFLKSAYGSEPWPRPFNVLQGLERIKAGETPKDAAKAVGTRVHVLEKAATSAHPEYEVLGLQPRDVTQDDLRKASVILGQLLIGRAAEMAFEDIYRSEIGANAEFKLVDLREGRTDTDYRVLNGRNRPIYRVNIKFFGSIFRRARDMVGLEPEDCFPLATYKIFGALQKQEQEHLPYIFAIVGVPNLTAVSIQDQLPADEMKFVALFSKSARVSGKRAIEDKVVERIVARRSTSFVQVYDRIRSSEWYRIRSSEWYVLSARKADKLLRDLLFERVGSRLRAAIPRR